MSKVKGKKSTSSLRSHTFAQQFEELEKIVASFEESDMDIEKSLQQFERGLELASSLKHTLEQVEQTVETLKKKYDVSEEE